MSAQSIYDFEVKMISGESRKVNDFKGKTLLIVNVASKCGFTPQYKGLEALYRKLKPRGFEILGFPCNQFGSQEPGSESDIQNFCSLTYDVTFPMFAKVDVNGASTHPLYQYLKSEEKGILGTEAIKWNFTKFLVSKDGKVMKRFAPATSPDAIEKEIVEIL
jgi:glutathione peroxidase